MSKRVGIAVTQPKGALEHVADLAMFGKSALLDDGGKLIERLSRFLLDVVKLGLDSLIKGTHKFLSSG
jgi:hypothetical protein